MSVDKPKSVSTVDIDSVTETIEIDGRSFPVVDHGEGPVVVLLHGFPDSRVMWRYQIPALVSAGFRVLAPDLRGFGDAPKPEAVEQYELPTIVSEDIVGLLDTMDIEEAHIVGHDWGAQVVWTMAALHPERVSSMSALTSGALGNSGFATAEQMRALWHLYYFQFDGATEERLRADDWELFRDWCEGGDDVDHYVEQLSRPGALTAALNWYRANAQPVAPADEPPAPPDVTCPVLGVLAEDDAYLLEPQMRNSTERIDLTEGSWRYESIPEASHWMTVDKPRATNRILVDFLTDQRE
jgi:pimeloyl-ACP methyl ester carboxylesterase